MVFEEDASGAVEKKFDFGRHGKTPYIGVDQPCPDVLDPVGSRCATSRNTVRRIAGRGCLPPVGSEE
jgi:hypothetical protein